MYVESTNRQSSVLKNILKAIGRVTVIYLEYLGRLTILSLKSIFAIRKFHIFIDQIVDGFIYVGRNSLLLIMITSAFMGLVLGVQIGAQISPLTPHWVEGGLILRLVLLEMGPIITGLVLAGRVSAGIASEIGEMKVTEQIDALRTMAVNPIEYLVMPRLLAGMFAVPMLIIFGDVVSILFGFFSSNIYIGLTWNGFVKGMRQSFVPTDVFTSVIKGYIFGIAIVLFGCFFGLQAKHGAKGVGKATTHAVIWSSIVIIILDYIISASLSFLW